MAKRIDDSSQQIYFQSGRFAIQNNEWYYLTRGDIQRGPFKNERDAKGDLSAFLIYQHNLENQSH